MSFRPMKSARFLLLALLPLLFCACIATVPAYVGGSPPAPKNHGLEKTFQVTGYVLDAVNNKPVAGAVVRFNGVGMYAILLGSTLPQTDASGYFVLHLPVSNLEKGGYLSVQTMLYEGRTSLPADTAQPVTLRLRRNSYRFKPFGCQQLADTVHIPPYVTMPILGYPGSQYAFLIRDSLMHQPHKLRTITFRTGHAAFSREPFRLRIYQGSDNSATPPGEELLPESFLICPNKEEGIWTYDVSEYDIIVSDKGFFLAMGYTIGGDKFYCMPEVTKYTPAGPILRPPCARPDIRTWENTGKGWHRATAVENCWPLYESAISVEVEPAPAKH